MISKTREIKLTFYLTLALWLGGLTLFFWLFFQEEDSTGDLGLLILLVSFVPALKTHYTHIRLLDRHPELEGEIYNKICHVPKFNEKGQRNVRIPKVVVIPFVVLLLLIWGFYWLM